MSMATMFWLSLFGLLQYICATPTPPRHNYKREDAVFVLKGAKPMISTRDINISDTTFILKEVVAITQSTRALLTDGSSKTAPLKSVLSGGAYAVNVQLSDQSFELLFDTGSSDLWVAQARFQCINMNGNAIPEARCHFGKLFQGTFDEGKVPNQHINIPYGSGELVAGVLGYEDVTVAGVTVDHQEVGLVQAAYFVSDDVTSGILGFAYSSITSAYRGNDLGGYSPSKLVHYTNFIGNVVKQGKIDPSFSIVLERAGGQSQLALGGLPTTEFNHDFTTVPLEMYEFSPNAPIEGRKFTYYTIEIDGFVLNDNTFGSDLHVIVDSGTTLMYMPAALAETINQAFKPPAKMRDMFWEVECDATPPSFAITIGGTDFVISSTEMLPPKDFSYDPATGLCVTGIQTVTQRTPPVLGGSFLKNVVAVFDIGAAQMRFAPHVNY